MGVVFLRRVFEYYIDPWVITYSLQLVTGLHGPTDVQAEHAHGPTSAEPIA